MSYTMQSPSQGYANPPAEVYGSRAYGGHLMSHNGIGNYPGYLNRDDPYNGSHYGTGPPLQPASHYVAGTSLAHHTYPSSMNHFASQQDMYNSCVVPSPSRTHTYPPPPNLSPTVVRGHVATPKSNSYWNCENISQGSTGVSTSAGHCYSSPTGAINSTHKSSPQAWSRSPNVMSSPSTTPSPIPCPPTPHHFASSPHHSQPHSDPHKSFNGVINNSSLTNNGNTGANINCNNNPLQSLQKMVQIDSEGGNQYDSGSTVSGQHSQVTAPPHSLTTGIEQSEGNYQNTYYNLDQSRLCSTPQQSPYPTIPAQSINSVPFSPSLKNSPELRSQTIPNNGVKQESGSENGDLNLNRTNSMRYNNKITKDSGYLNNGSACSTDNCSNDSPSAQSSSKVTPIIESSIQGEHTHDSLNSFRGSETTANSRDSVKSSDSDAMSSYAMSQCSTPNSTWKAMNPNVNQSSEFRPNSYGSNTQSKSWWNENSIASNNRPFASQNLTECASYSNQGVNYSITHSIANQPTSSNQSWTQASNISSQGSVPPISGPNYVTQPDGVVKKKRGRPFGSKNRRNVESGQAVEAVKRKRKVMLVDIGINTNLSFDVSATLHHDDSIAFSEASSVKHPLPLAVRRKKVVGPVIRIDKSPNEFLPAKYSIVNNSLKCTDDEKDLRMRCPPAKSAFDMCSQSRKNGLTKKSFNLGSNNLNLTIGDKSWICILCHKGPNYKGLGDLYGPYLVTMDKSKLSIAHEDTCSVQSDSHEETTREVTPERRSLRRRPESNDDKSKTPVNQAEETKETNITEMEVWIHEDCIVWSNSVYLEGTKIRNLEPAIIESFDNICTKCKLPGATLGCIFKNCSVSPLHYLCAKDKDCDLDEEKFILSCSKHKKRRMMSKELDHGVEVSEATTTATTET